jgi:outer membrane protein assembly factor BamB
LLWEYTPRYTAGSIAVDSIGNVYTNDSATLLKLDSNGVKIWEFKFFNSPSTLAIDSQGGIYAGFGNSYNDIQKVKSDGTSVLWSRKVGFVYSIAVDNHNNIFVCCNNTGLYKLTSDGKEVYSRIMSNLSEEELNAKNLPDKYTVFNGSDRWDTLNKVLNKNF